MGFGGDIVPIYEYRCKDCGHEFEELVFSTKDKPVCPQCGSDQTEKLMSACSAKVDGGPDLSGLHGSCSGSGGG